MDNKPKNLIIIGANEFQNPLILTAKAMGYTTHVFAWQSGDVGERTADYFYPISIVELDRILNICRMLSPVGMVSIGSDLAAITPKSWASPATVWKAPWPPPTSI